MWSHMGPHGRPSIGIENGQARWHGSAGRFGRQGTGGNRKNAARRWGGAVLAGAFSGRGLPLPVTKPTHNVFGLWVVPGNAMLKVFVGYDSPAWVKMRTAPL